MLAVDTNVLIYAADADAQFHAPYRDWLERQRVPPDAWYTTQGILYEFLRASTHPRVMRRPGTCWRRGVRLGAARLAGPRPARPDRTIRRCRWKGGKVISELPCSFAALAEVGESVTAPDKGKGSHSRVKYGARVTTVPRKIGPELRRAILKQLGIDPREFDAA